MIQIKNLSVFYHGKEGKIKVLKVNVDEETLLASEFAIVSIPTVLLIKNGKIVEKSVGARSFDDFCDMIDKYLWGTKS